MHIARRAKPRLNRTPRGFTLIEVMIAMVVASVGLLGLAKLQALTISGSKNAGSRSLIVLQVGSLVSSMHANRDYWTSSSAPTSFSASALVITDTSGVLSATPSACLSACSAAEVATHDVNAWVLAMNALMPSYGLKVDCTQTKPVSCEIYLTWKEKVVAIGKSTEASAANRTETKSFSVFVKP